MGLNWRKLRIRLFGAATAMYWLLLDWGQGKRNYWRKKAAFLFQTNQCREPQKILAISFKTDAATDREQLEGPLCGPFGRAQGSQS